MGTGHPNCVPYQAFESADGYIIMAANNDTQFIRGNLATGDDFYHFIRGAIDLLRAEGTTSPGMMSVGMHMRLLGHPARASGLARLLDYLAGLDDVWICRRADIARHWIARHPLPMR